MNEIQHVISKFAHSFDTKEWERMRSTLSDEVLCDYSDLRGGVKDTVGGDVYVAKRMEALDNIHTHHLISNYEITVTGGKASCTASAIIWRKAQGKEFNTHAQYTFELQKKTHSWRICSIKQEIYWNKGDPSIHSGVQK
nr:nuclear transport factor 2 family protein [Fodinibius sediminis]